jgi:hypothetical protein
MTNVDEMPAHDPAIGETGNDARNPGFPSIEFKSPFTLSKAKSCHRIHANRCSQLDSTLCCRQNLHTYIESSDDISGGEEVQKRWFETMRGHLLQWPCWAPHGAH